MPPFSPTRLARPPAAVVPVAPLVEAGGRRAEGRGCHRPRDGVRRRRPDHLVAARAPVGLRGGGPGHLAYDVLLAGVPLDAVGAHALPDACASAARNRSTRRSGTSQTIAAATNTAMPSSGVTKARAIPVRYISGESLPFRSRPRARRRRSPLPPAKMIRCRG